MMSSASLAAALLAWGGCALAGGASPAVAAREPSAPSYEIVFKEASIQMPDGVRLAADLYLPAGGKRGERCPRPA